MVYVFIYWLWTLHWNLKLLDCSHPIMGILLIESFASIIQSIRGVRDWFFGSQYVNGKVCCTEQHSILLTWSLNKFWTMIVSWSWAKKCNTNISFPIRIYWCTFEVRWTNNDLLLKQLPTRLQTDSFISVSTLLSICNWKNRGT